MTAQVDDGVQQIFRWYDFTSTFEVERRRNNESGVNWKIECCKKRDCVK